MALAVRNKLNSVQEKMHRHWSFFRQNPRRIAKILFKAGFKYIAIIILVKLLIIAINIAVFLLLRILFGSSRIPANSALRRVLTVSRIINNAKRLYYVLKRLWGRGGFESLVQFAGSFSGHRAVFFVSVQFSQHCVQRSAPSVVKALFDS